MTAPLAPLSKRREEALAKIGFSWDHWRRIEPLTVSCPVCHGTTTRPWVIAELSPGPIVQCVTCDMVFVNPVLVRGVDLPAEDERIAEELRHSNDLSDLDRSWEKRQLQLRLDEMDSLKYNHRVILGRMNRHMPAKGRHLDVGAGWGFMMESARGDGWETAGVEPMPGHALYARQALGLDVRCEVLGDNSYPANHFDVVTAIQVFEHMEDPAAELRNIHRVLRPGGLVLIEVPSIGSPLAKIMKGRFRQFVPDHFWFFSPATLRKFVEANGFDTVEVYRPGRRYSPKWYLASVGQKFLPPKMTKALERAIDRYNLTRFHIPVNVLDIVMIVARKRPS